MVKRTVLLAALAVVGQLFVMAGPAIAKTKTRACSSVTVGLYRATNVRVTPNLGCAAARSDLRIWLKHPSKLPHNSKSWHSKLVGGTWEMAYGRYAVSLFFALVKLTTPTPTTTPPATPPTSAPPPTPHPPPTPPPTPPPNPTPTPAPHPTPAAKAKPADPVPPGSARSPGRECFPYTATA